MTQKNRAGVMLAAARATLLLSLLEPDKTLRECAVAALTDEILGGPPRTLEDVTALESGVLELARSLLAEALDTAPWSDGAPEAVRALERQWEEREQSATAL